MNALDTAINTLEHISSTSLPAAQMRRIIRELLLQHLYPQRNLERTALSTIKDFLEWGAKTGSDRELFDDKFRELLKQAGIEFKEPD